MSGARSPRFLIGVGAAVAAIVAVVAVVVARSGGDDAAVPPTTLGATTTSAVTAPSTSAAGTLPPTVATTVPSTTTPAATTTVAATTSTSVAVTTTVAPGTSTSTVAPAATTTTTIDEDAVPAFPCTADGLLAAFARDQTLPPGSRIDDVRCYGLFAAGVLSGNGQNRSFAVFGAGDTAWRLLNVGTAFVCQPLEITDPAYTTIGCPTWDI